MKILLLCWRDTNHPQGGGSERYLERVGEYLARHGHEVYFRTAHYPGAAKQETHGFPGGGSLTFSRSGGEYSVYPHALAAILAARLHLPLGGLRALGKPEVVVDTQNGIPFGSVLVSGAPSILLTHHCHREQWPVAGAVMGKVGWFIESRLAPFLYRKSRYVTVSRPSADELVNLGIRRSRIDIVRNGVDKAPDEATSTTDTTSPPLPEAGEPRLVTLSRLVPHKRIEHAIDLLADLRPDYPNIHLDIIGSGWWETELRSYVERKGVSEAVTFYGHVTEELKHEILARATLHIMPSRKEGWGLAVIEAAEHGVPTLGYSSSAGLRDSIVSGHTGLLAESYEDLVALTRSLVEDEVRLRRMSEASLRRSEAFTWEKTGEEFFSIIADATAPAPSAWRRLTDRLSPARLKEQLRPRWFGGGEDAWLPRGRD